jgi:hypothetical protein
MTDSEFRAPDIKIPEVVSILDYTVPIWTGNSPEGSKLEVLKGGSIMKTIEIKDKQYFVFGRQEGTVDIL